MKQGCLWGGGGGGGGEGRQGRLFSGSGVIQGSGAQDIIGCGFRRGFRARKLYMFVLFWVGLGVYLEESDLR